jgi:hypothetical protein
MFKNKPIGIWIVCIYLGVTTLWGLNLYTDYLITGHDANNPYHVALSSHGLLGWAWIYFKQFWVLGSCTLLFRLNAKATYGFFVYFCISIISSIWMLVESEPQSTAELIGLAIGAAFGPMLIGGIYLYVVQLSDKGVLNNH